MTKGLLYHRCVRVIAESSCCRVPLPQSITALIMGYPTPFVRSVLIDFSLLAPMLWFESTCVIEQRVWVVDTATDPFAVAAYITTTLGVVVLMLEMCCF